MTAHPIPPEDAMPELVRLYLRQPDVAWAQAIVDPADCAHWLGGTIDGIAWVTLQRELTRQLRELRTDDCDCTERGRYLDVDEYERDECPRCDGTGRVPMSMPRVLRTDLGRRARYVCAGCEREVGERDHRCETCGVELIADETTSPGLALETLLRMSVEGAANDVRGGAA